MSNFSVSQEEVFKLRDRIKELEQAQPKWISVKDRLPNNDKPERFLVLAHDITGEWREVATHFGGDWFFDNEKDYPAIITHWMPPPKPPEVK